MLLLVPLLLALLLACLPTQVQAQRSPLDEPRFVRLDDKVVIGDGVVTALAEDDQGFVWAGTAVGLVRHDGYQLRPVAITDASSAGRTATRFVRTLLAVPGGQIWAGLEGEGLARLDTRQGRWTLYKPEAGGTGARSPGTVHALAAEASGALWIGTTGGGLYRLTPGAGHFERVAHAGNGRLPDDRVQALRLGRDGQLWVGTWRGLVRKRPGADRFEPVPLQGAGGGAAGSAVTMLGEGPDARLWVGLRDGGLALLDPATAQVTWVEHGSGGNGVSFAVASSTEVWVGRTDGLDLRDARSGALLQRLQRSLHKPWGLAGHNVVALLRDASGQMWVGSYGGGIQRHTPSEGIWVRRGEGADGSPFADGDVRSLHQLRSGEIWAGTPTGAVAVLDDRLALRTQLLPQSLPGGIAGFKGGLAGAITEAADGSVWVGSDTGIYVFSPDRRLLAHHAVGGVRTRRLLAAADGSLWAATQDGVHRLQPGAQRFERVMRRDGGTLAGNVNALAQSADGTVWVGSVSGLWRVPPDTDRLHAVPTDDGAALQGEVVLGLLIDRRGRLWVDTNSGLYVWRDLQQASARFERIGGTADLEPGSFGANLLEDRDGRIWTHQHMHDPRDGSVQELGVADGVDFGTGWFRSYAQLSDGRLLFGGSTGVLVVEPSRVRRWAYRPPTVVTDVRINGERQPVARLHPVLRLSPQERALSIEFAALDLTQPDRNRYRYRLDGYDAQWTETGADFRVASYGNLPPGAYRLQVQGSNRMGDWSPRLLQLDVQVLPAWWQTWWARAVALAVLLLAVWTLVQLRTRLLRRRQAVLEDAVRARTGELEALSRQLQQKSAELEASSLTDPLTGLRNRRFLVQQMTADAALLARRHGEWQRQAAADPAARPPAEHDMVFFLIDVDHFKAVNDAHGHAAGDAVLLQVCDRLRQVFREADHLVRWGGEEFLVAARDTSRERAAEMAERARRAIADTPFQVEGGQPLALTASIGFAAFPLAPTLPAAIDWNATVDLADAALYVVKRGGRDGWFGLVRAEGSDAPALRQASRGALADWLAGGQLAVRGSRPFQPS